LTQRLTKPYPPRKFPSSKTVPVSPALAKKRMVQRTAVEPARRAEVTGAAATMMSGFELNAGDPQKSASADKATAPAAKAEFIQPFARPVSPAAINASVEAVHDATEIPHLFGLYHTADMTKVMDIMRDKSPAEIKAMNTAYAEKYSQINPATGKRADLMEQFKATLSGQDFERITKLVNEKNTSDVPVAARIDGSQLIKDGEKLKVGETNHLTLPDGRKYDLYIPVNAQKPLPLIVAMHGATGGDPPSLMEHESGLNIEAERKGMAVAYLYPKVHEETGLFGIKQEVGAWNMQGKKNLLPTDPSYDDAKYVDDVISKVKSSVTVDNDRVGMIGMSDGGRFAEDYAGTHQGISGVVAESGTWMQGEKPPEHGENVMEVHGTSDHMLPFDQGKNGSNNRGFMSWLASSWIPGTSESRPWQQEQVWRAADGATTPAKVTDNGKITIDDSVGPGGEVKTYLIKGANHAIHDYKNQGGMMFGMPDRDLDFSSTSAQFILDHPLHRSLEN
jgi:poly(3-hydroxybutyrate) depolymerase